MSKHPHDFTEVKITTIDSYIEQLDSTFSSGNTIFKIDTEGFESDVLKGSRNSLVRLMPFIICEMRDKSNPTDTESILKEYNYIYFLITDSGLLRSKHIYIDSRFRDWLFVPSERAHYLTSLMKSLENDGKSSNEKKGKFIYLQE